MILTITRLVWQKTSRKHNFLGFSMNIFEQTIQELAQLADDAKDYTGDELTVNNNNAVVLEYNELFVTLQYRESNDDICIFAPVTDPDKIDKLDQGTLRNALTLAHKGQGTENNFLGLFNGHLILSNKISMQNVTGGEIADKVAEFSDAAFKVANSLLAVNSEEQTPKDNDFLVFENQLIRC